MCAISPLDLYPGDIVVVEVYIVRSQEPGSGATSAVFYLNAVNVLSQAPRPLRVQRPEHEAGFCGHI